CKMIAPILEELNKQEGNRITIAKLNVDENSATAAKYQIMGIPTLKLFKDGKEVETIMGAQPLGVLQQMVAQYA
ncbi:MAG TPA: thioredoxin, partial [Paenibacillaceae bacterium]|nr:thioredoxin [Paenibacillaceae bacterium]